MERLLIALAGLMGFLAVALGAFGAHGLRSRLQALPDFSQRMEWWQTAASYHLHHALAIAFAAWLASRGDSQWPRNAGLAFALGIILFSGSLYTMTVTGTRWLGAVTPLGGLSFLLGWVFIVLAALRT